ncbi:unnamed protein product [Prunus armeniaca]
MDDSRVAKCTYSAGTLMLILSSTTTFDWLSNELCSRFKLKLGHFELRYSFTDCSNCLLESDDDLKIMFMEGYITHEGQKFEGGVCEFRDKLAKYSIENGFKMKYLKNEPRRVIVVCAKKESNDYEWHVHDVKSNVNGFFYIKNLNNAHSCSGLIREKRNKAMGSRLVSSIVKDKVRSNPLVRLIELITDLKENYGLHIPYHVAWCGKESATKDLHGDEKLSYANLPWPPLMVFGGVGLCCPLMVLSSQTSTRVLFYELLQRMEIKKYSLLPLRLHPVTLWTIRCGFCKGYLKSWWMKLLYVPTVEEYQDTLKKLRDDGGSKIIDKFLADLPAQNFANAFFPRKRYGEVSNALSESFNSWLKDVRKLPIYEMIDTVRIKMMEMISRRKLASEKWSSVLCPVIEDELKNLAAKGRHWRICRAGESIFEVHADLSVMVNLDERFCSCYQWQLLGFPCQHAIQVIQHSGLRLYNFVDEYYKADFYRVTYATPIFPIPDTEKPHPGDVFLLPPHTKKPPRRPPTKRFKLSSETKRQVKCKRCGSCDCHNRRTYKFPI